MKLLRPLPFLSPFPILVLASFTKLSIFFCKCSSLKLKQSHWISDKEHSQKQGNNRMLLLQELGTRFEKKILPRISKFTYRFSWLAIDSRILTMVVWGSDGLTVEVAETVDGCVFFFPKKFIISRGCPISKTQMGKWGEGFLSFIFVLRCLSNGKKTGGVPRCLLYSGRVFSLLSLYVQNHF